MSTIATVTITIRPMQNLIIWRVAHGSMLPFEAEYNMRKPTEAVKQVSNRNVQFICNNFCPIVMPAIPNYVFVFFKKLTV